MSNKWWRRNPNFVVVMSKTRWIVYGDFLQNIVIDPTSKEKDASIKKQLKVMKSGQRIILSNGTKIIKVEKPIKVLTTRIEKHDNQSNKEVSEHLTRTS